MDLYKIRKITKCIRKARNRKKSVFNSVFLTRKLFSYVDISARRDYVCIPNATLNGHATTIAI